MRTPDPGLPWAISRGEAREAGMSDRQVERRLGSGAWVRERRGWYRLGSEDAAARAPGIGLVAAARSAPSRDLVLSHQSAARAWGLPEPLAGWPVPTFTASTGATRYRSELIVRVAPLPHEDVTTRGALAVTTAPRTVADCLRVLRPRDGLALLDAALHGELVTVDQVHDVLTRQKGWPGISQARQVLPLGDGRRESPLESWSAWDFDRLDVPPPQWQVEVRTAAGEFLGRADAWWPEGVVGEADGRVKYRLEAARRGGATPEVLAGILDQERAREQRLRETGADVQRWGADDLLRNGRAEALATRLRAAIRHAADHPRFTGRTSSR